MVYGPPVTEPATFVAEMLKVYVPATVDEPDSTPDAESRDSPAGNAPAVSANVGAGVPVAVNVNVYGCPTTSADGGAPEVMVGASFTVSRYGPAVTVPATFVADTLKVYVPAAVGEPDNTPETGSRDRPGGSAPAAIAKAGAGAPLAVTAK
jgi:hypothetical protein